MIYLSLFSLALLNDAATEYGPSPFPSTPPLLLLLPFFFFLRPRAAINFPASSSSRVHFPSETARTREKERDRERKPLLEYHNNNNNSNVFSSVFFRLSNFAKFFLGNERETRAHTHGGKERTGAGETRRSEARRGEARISSRFRIPRAAERAENAERKNARRPADEEQRARARAVVAP